MKHKICSSIERASRSITMEREGRQFCTKGA